MNTTFLRQTEKRVLAVTLVELLTIIAIIGLTFAMIIPAGWSAKSPAVTTVSDISQSDTGNTAVTTFTEEWLDVKRNRTVPVRVYLPKNVFDDVSGVSQDVPQNVSQTGVADRRLPVFLLSHGLGGSRDGFPYLGNFLAQHRMVVIVLQHQGSDSSVWQQRSPNTPVMAAMNAAANSENARKRVEDVRFVLDELENKVRDFRSVLAPSISEGLDRNNPASSLGAVVDLDRIGVGGHSFGSHTTFCVVGRTPYTADPRVKAAVAMSPNLPTGAPASILRPIRTPVLHLTGTKDTSPIDTSLNPTDRRIPYDTIRSADQYLLIFKDGDHTLFSGHARLRGLSAMEKRYQAVVQETVWRFLDTYLNQANESKTWLQGDGLQKIMAPCGMAEWRQVAK